ncbi:MAG: LysR family transcriptional regulator [Alphaproteobacteria bacterium]|nr:LysR family transcriptional regulator [Alphaproteobacteria bacterium]MBT4083941.1 LysR family transcriptional regulator [Alphaproteobacteria bacterium]MBT4542528.1 LysR family transcriptional regulator [Alphaproteobacteria bacterium]MBT7747482.1 LysR family transcriptional regulator [Alphaproteobacteria bacterium]
MSDNIELLDGITVFTAVVENGGFSAAAKKLGRSVSFVSKAVTKLEERLKVRLLNRTTRSVVPTDTGQAYYERCRQIVSAALEAEHDMAASHQTPQGHLKISMPVSFGRSYLNDALPEFLNTYPLITLNADLNDRFVDVIAEGYDVVIRAGILKESSLIARKLGSSRLMTLASPAYLEKHGTPQVPEDLKAHACISWAGFHTAHWTFANPEGQSITVQIEPRIICNSAELELPMALNSVGITQLPGFICNQEVANGSLVPVLCDYEVPPIGIYAVYPHRVHLSAKVRVFVDFLVSAVRKNSPILDVM